MLGHVPLPQISLPLQSVLSHIQIWYVVRHCVICVHELISRLWQLMYMEAVMNGLCIINMFVHVHQYNCPTQNVWLNVVLMNFVTYHLAHVNVILDTLGKTAVKVTMNCGYRYDMYSTLYVVYVYAVCSQGTYGRNCNGMCPCEAGSCHHVTGRCTCFPDYHGENCSHSAYLFYPDFVLMLPSAHPDCTGAPDCASLGREACSLSTPENTCGVCHSQPAGDDVQWGNSSCAYSTSMYSTSVYTASVYSTSIEMQPTTTTYSTPSLTEGMHDMCMKQSDLYMKSLFSPP